MTEYDAIEFPAFQLASGRWVKFAFGVQEITPFIKPAMFGDPVAMEEHPWALGGLPEIIDEAAPDVGLMSADSIDFVFHNIPVKPSEDDTTLHDIIMSKDPQKVVWNIKYWISPGYTNTFNTPPDFWGIIDSSEIEGEYHPEDKTWNTYKLTARNSVALGEKVSIDLWLNGPNGNDGYLQHVTYDVTAGGGVFIEDDKLRNVYMPLTTDNSSSEWLDIETYPETVRMFRLVDVIWSISNAMSVTQPLNNTGTGSGSLAAEHTWGFFRRYHPDDEYTIDDLVLVSAMYHDIGGAPQYDQRYGFFDTANIRPCSVFGLGNVLEALKRFLVPLGLVASVRCNAAGQRYMEVREAETDTAATASDANILQGMEIEAGEKAAFGMSVTTCDNGEIADGENGDKNLDNVYIGASRILIGGRWTHTTDPHNTDDLPAFFSALYVIVEDEAHNISRIVPRRGGVERATVSAVMPTPPYVEPSPPTWYQAQWEEWAHEAGSVFAKAALSYYWNGAADHITDPVGIFRRYTQKLIWGEVGTPSQLGVRVGDYRTVAGKQYVIRRMATSASPEETWFEGERGTYDAPA